MIVIPQKLFDNPHVQTLLRDGNVCIIEKILPTSLEQREGYISTHVISILLEGTQTIQTYDGEHITVQAGEILFIPKGLYYITDLVALQGCYRSLLFYFDNAILETFLTNNSISDFSKKTFLPYLKFQKIKEVEHYMDALLAICKNNGIRNKFFLELKILELLYLLSTLSKDDRFLHLLFQLSLPKKRNIQDFMKHNFDKPLKIEDYAYLTGRSISSFRRDFKNAFDITPQKWIKRQRLHKAVELIQAGSDNVTHLAFKVGYENISYFIQEFKNFTGRSPKQYILELHRNQLLD